MLTADASDVNGSAATPRSVMMSIGELAARDKVSKPAVSRMVKRLCAHHGLEVERGDRGQVTAVNAAQYDELRNRVADPSKAQADPPAPTPASKPGETYDEAIRQKTWIDAERARLRLAAEVGELIPVASLVDAVPACAEAIAAVIDRLLNQVDDMAAAVGREGPHGLRVLIKQIVFRSKTEVADALAALAALSGNAPPPAAPADAPAEPPP